MAGWCLRSDPAVDHGALLTWTMHAEADGSILVGTNHYVLHFAPGQEPPARGFWSLVVHDERCLPVDNPIRRFSIGDRNALTFNPDGSLDIHVGSAPPPRELMSNWLPAPPAPFHLLLNIYEPAPAAARGDWMPPVPTRRAGSHQSDPP